MYQGKKCLLLINEGKNTAGLKALNKPKLNIKIRETPVTVFLKHFFVNTSSRGEYMVWINIDVSLGS